MACQNIQINDCVGAPSAVAFIACRSIFLVPQSKVRAGRRWRFPLSSRIFQARREREFEVRTCARVMTQNRMTTFGNEKNVFAHQPHAENWLESGRRTRSQVIKVRTILGATSKGQKHCRPGEK